MMKWSERCLKAPSWAWTRWEALSKDRNAYSISVLTERDETIITSLSCRELSATSKMLLHRSGSRSKAAGCRIT